MSNKCYQCGTIHDGWSCPICSVKEKVEESTKEQQQAIEESLEEQERMLEKQREAIESSIEDARMEMEYALEEATVKHQKTTAEAWKLQAEAKADRAYELYKANLYEEATNLCFEAISQDPGNIRAYRFAAWSFEKLGQHEKAKELLKKQINLLKTSYYRNSQGHALRVLQDILEIQKNENLMRSFLDASKVFSYFPADLIDELIKRSLYNNTRKLYLNTVEYSNNILGCAYGIELNNEVLLGRENLEDRLNKYLKSLSYTHKNNIFEVFKEIKSSGKFSNNTTNFIREKIIKRYEEWKPEIKREIEETAFKQAKKKADEKSSPTVIGWVVGICSFLPWMMVGDTVFKSESVSMPFSSLIALFELVVVFGGPIATAIFTSYLLQSSIENKVKSEIVTAMEKKEKENLQEI